MRKQYAAGISIELLTVMIISTIVCCRRATVSIPTLSESTTSGSRSDASDETPPKRTRAKRKRQAIIQKSEALIKKGCFLMSEKYRDEFGTVPIDNYVVHRVCLNSYTIDRHEVTVQKYNACINVGKCKNTPFKNGCNIRHRNRAMHPMNCVTWLQARAYCRWKGKRLPTEAEWERAGRGKQGFVYPWGNSQPTCKKTVMCGRKGNSPQGCGRGTTWPVGSKAKDRSPFGVYDMAGNVGEWVSDWADVYYYKKSPLWNPKGPKTGSERVIRGGDYDNYAPAAFRLTYRHIGDPTNSSVLNGFRCARSIGD